MDLIPWKRKRVEKTGEPTDTGLVRLREGMEDLFERLFREPFGTAVESPWRHSGWGPRLDLAESADDVAVNVELPGVDPKDIEIDVSGNMLTIRGEKKEEKEEKRRDHHYVERTYGSFYRSVQLPGSADPDKVNAAFKNGVLTITVAKRPEAKAKKITVRHA
jgi:HSP20 family protein